MKSFPNIPLVAIILIFIGADLLLDRADIFDSTWLQLAGAIMVTSGLLNIIYSFRDSDTGAGIWGGVLLITGAIFMVPSWWDRINWDQFWNYVWDYWPVILILVGINILIRSFFPKKKKQQATP